MPGPQPPAIPFPDHSQPFGEYFIREQSDFDAMFRSIESDVNNTLWGAWLDNEMRELEALHREWFDTAARMFFSGGGWAPNAQSTVRAKGHSRVLFGKPHEGFRLFKSLTEPNSEFGIRYDVDEWPRLVEVVFGTDAPYSAPNQFGVPSKNIPARPHVGMTSEHFDKVAERALNHVFAAIQES